MNVKDRWDAKYYKKHSAGQYKSGIDFIDKQEWNGDESVLDVGCGDGRTTAEIAKCVPNGYVLGIDASQNMIDEAKKSFKDVKNLEFECIDAAKFSSDKKFDQVVSFSVFHWIKDQLAALKNIYNVLKPDGLLYIKMGAYHKGPVTEVYEGKKWSSFWEGKEETYFPQTVERFKDMLEKCGFKNIDVKPKISSRCFQSKDEIFNWAFAWVPHFTGLPIDKAKEFTNDIVDSICVANKPGELILEIKIFECYGQK